MVWNCGRSWSYLYANHLPFCLLSNKLKYPGFFYDFSICLITFVKAEFFDVNVSFQKEKLRENVVFTTTVLHIYFIPLIPICKFPLIRQISWETEMSPLISQLLAFLGTLFDYRDFVSFTSDFSFHILMWKGFEKCC